MTLQEILVNTSAYLDQSTDLPTGDDYDTRVNYANQRISEWENAYRFENLKSKYVLSATLASIPLPSNFSAIGGNPKVLLDSNNNWDEYTQVDPSYIYDQRDPKFSYILNDTIIFNGLTSGATVSIDYFRTATALATLTDVCEVPDCNYVVNGIIASVLQARGDDRFPVVESKTQNLLMGMIGDNQSSASSSTRVPKKSYHLGTR